MKTCQNCGWHQELCGEYDCHNQGVKTVNESGECSAWEADLATMKKAWKTLREEEGCPPDRKCRNEIHCARCVSDYAMEQAIEGGRINETGR